MAAYIIGFYAHWFINGSIKYFKLSQKLFDSETLISKLTNVIDMVK